MSEPTKEQIAEGLAYINGLRRVELYAFLALFAGARFPWTIYDGEFADRPPFIGKAECEMVPDWREFYSKRLPEKGLFDWEVGESSPALGMVRKPDGAFHAWTKINCGPTQLGWAVRDAWWASR